ncbi:uncharacterized protein LOC114531112 [Dendronephthya gigantea]|uniref:uncharacterized protein LOC114531112 n=1 Tax=Dendronephthya gigantea TaxID=151771 RepID=UPI00106985E1|nr:uncharacterized protein LOC114531112 [Dendronephthya gigantea]
MDSSLQKCLRTAEWISKSPLSGGEFVPTSADERKSFTKVFGPTTPQKQYLIKVKDSTLCLSENTYLHREPVQANDWQTKLSDEKLEAHEKFENNCLSSCVDDEMKRMQRSKFLNTKLSSVDGRGVRKREIWNDGSLVDNQREKMFGKEGLEKNGSLCEVKGVMLRNNEEKIGKYSRQSRNIIGLAKTSKF